MLKKRFRAPRGGLHVNWKRLKKRTEGVTLKIFFFKSHPHEDNTVVCVEGLR